MMSPLSLLLARIRAGEGPTPQEWEEAIGVLPAHLQDVVVPVLAAIANGHDPDLAAIGAALSPPIHRTSVLRRLRTAGKVLPDLFKVLAAS